MYAVGGGARQELGVLLSLLRSLIPFCPSLAPYFLPYYYLFRSMSIHCLSFALTHTRLLFSRVVSTVP